MNIYTPVNGKAKRIEEVSDAVFAGKMLGDGFAVTPTSETVVAPISGKVSAVFPTNHAFGIEGDDGVEVLVHIGVDTVTLEGKGFTGFVKQGDHVTAGDSLAKVDFDWIAKQGIDTDVIVVVTNSNAYTEFNLLDGEDVKVNDIIFNVK